jgi:diguanylate cyclase (GGDEF)-like protein/PAS domain S-box-containing protein
VIGLTTAALIAVLYFTSQVIVLGSFAEQEDQDIRQNIERVRSSLNDSLASLEGTTRDWAIWDDTYAFVQDPDNNQNYFKSNLSNNTPMISNRLNLMLFINEKGSIIFAKALDYRTGKDAAVPDVLMQQATPGSSLLQHKNADSSLKGILSVPEGVLLVASEPVLPSSGIGSVQGTLIFGRYLDTAEIQRLSKSTLYALTARTVNDKTLPEDFKSALLAMSSTSPILVRSFDSETISAYALLDDLYGKPALIMRADLPRQIYSRGKQTVQYYMVALLVAGVVFAGVVVLLVKRLVLARLATLNRELGRIEADGHAALVSESGNDEIASLAGSINRMLAGLDKAYTEQIESEERYRSVLEQVTEAIFLVDEETGRFIEANAAAHAMLGYDDRELARLTIDEITAPEVNGFVNYRRTTTAKLRMVVERAYRRKNGTVLHVEVSDSVISHGGRRVLCVVARDITDRKRAEAVLRDLAMRDGLTGLYNRREMSRMLREEFERCQHSGEPLSLVMFDMDHFKTINDSYGHQVGDDVLRWAARLASELVREEDRVARYGGEEFAVIMPGASSELAYEVAERIRTAFEGTPFAFEGTDGDTVLIPVTVSLGLASVSLSEDSEEALLAAADRALYRAKHEGRNRTVAHTAPEHTLQAISS